MQTADFPNFSLSNINFLRKSLEGIQLVLSIISRSKCVLSIENIHKTTAYLHEETSEISAAILQVIVKIELKTFITFDIRLEMYCLWEKVTW